MGKYPSLLIGIFAHIRQCFAYFFMKPEATHLYFRLTA